ncbi:uncharacterized protein [Euphorbia lathyris]|uniref:uncharacterized protein isoform X1 n=1 Tax=Euphorbia lathyris TaxID=212925 RepID=UPI0033144D6C
MLVESDMEDVKGLLDDESEVTREFRDLRPVHYLFKIENFSLLSNVKVDKYESPDFELGGYNWRLCVYPEGKKKVNENKHISLYLVVSKSNSFTLHKEVNVYFKLFVYNQILDKYLTVQDAKGRVSRFSGTKTERGFDQVLPLNVFNDASNGYLIDDCCIFGAEVFVLAPINKGVCVSLVKELVNNSTYTWNVQIQNSAGVVKQESCISEVFVIGGYKWTLLLYPNGNSSQKGKSLSLFLQMHEALTHGHKLSVEFVVRVKDQLHGKHHEKTTTNQFYGSIGDWGFSDLIPLSKLNDKLNDGYLIKGGIILEVQFSLMILTKEFS